VPARPAKPAGTWWCRAHQQRLRGPSARDAGDDVIAARAGQGLTAGDPCRTHNVVTGSVRGPSTPGRISVRRAGGHQNASGHDSHADQAILDSAGRADTCCCQSHDSTPIIARAAASKRHESIPATTDRPVNDIDYGPASLAQLRKTRVPPGSRAVSLPSEAYRNC
jgi:hypothetical protein